MKNEFANFQNKFVSEEKYKECYKLTNEQLKEKDAWDSNETIFIFDTNVLLSQYKHKDETSELFFYILEEIKDKIWLPHQVGLEFYKNLKNNQWFMFNEIKKELDGFIKQIDEKGKLQARNLLNVARFSKANKSFDILFDRLYTDLKKNYQDILNEYRKEQDEFIKNDTILKKIEDLFKGKIGKPFNQDELDNIYSEGEIRYLNKIPPGFLDNNKGSDVYVFNEVEYKRKFGDLILWKQIIQKCTDTSIKNVIFITNDQKDKDNNQSDWWKGDEPKIELIIEIKKETKIDLFYMYNFTSFIDKCSEFLALDAQKILKIKSNRVNELVNDIASLRYLYDYYISENIDNEIEMEIERMEREEREKMELLINKLGELYSKHSYLIGLAEDMVNQQYKYKYD